jgi:hypothetical protein
MRTSHDRSGALESESGRRLGVVLGALAAGLASAGVVYWMGVGSHRPAPAPSGLAAPVGYAPARPDPDQVMRAYEQLQEVYGARGTSGVTSFARSCANAVRADPGMLDFCLAFDLYAAALGRDEAAVGAWRAEAESRDLALARSVLPAGEDAAARLAEVGAMARKVSLDAFPTAAGSKAARPATPRTGAHHGVAPRRAATASGIACGPRATRAQRTVCASPALRDADQRMRRAYRQALAAGAGAGRLAREQARFHAEVDAVAPDRAAMARLYHRRTQALERIARQGRAGG